MSTLEERAKETLQALAQAGAPGNEAVERLYGLNVGTVGSGAMRHERPHKPILILAVLDAIATGLATPRRIMWSNALRGRFKTYFECVQERDDRCTPENPFLHLKGDGFWQPMEVVDQRERPLERTPTARDAAASNVFARLTDGFDRIVMDAGARALLRNAIVSRYFPTHRAAIEALYTDTPSPKRDSEVGAIQEEPPLPFGRNPAFRRKILEVYDSQCAACGLRIKLPETDVTFVDGAHLIPFTVSRNDHPTNGIALCKNHHWAMDRFLIVPTPDGVWSVSSRLDARRSSGEKALCALNRRPVLPPHDEAFRPRKQNLLWRTERLLI